MKTVDTQSLIELVGQVGVGGAVLVGAIWKLNSELDKRDKIYNERHQEMKDEIKELKEENKQDKQMFSQAFATFDNAVREFSLMSSKMTNLEVDVKEIRNDIRDLKK